MRAEVIAKVKEMAREGKSKREIREKTQLSRQSVYLILTGKKYKYSNTRGIKYGKITSVRGLSDSHKENIFYIAKNKGVSQNRLLLTYIREAINREPKENKTYEYD